MSGVSVWRVLLGVERHVVIEGVEVEAGDGGEVVVVVSVRSSRRQGSRCPRCGRRCPGYDRGDGRRRWRGLDLGSTRVFLEAEAPRVRCREHGVIVAAVSWARHGSAFTAAFEEQTAWLAAHTAASVVAVLTRSSWRAVTAMVARVVAEARGRSDRLAGVVKIAIDEKAYRKGHRYLTVVTDLDTGRVVWAAEGRSKATVEAFFTALGTQRAAALTHVGCDGADWIHTVVKAKAPNAVLCLDSFHVVAWASEAVDDVRRRIVQELKATGRGEDAATLKGSRWAVLKNPANLTDGQTESLASIKKTNGPLYRAYLIKEQLREVFRIKGVRGRRLLAGVIAWASRSRIPEMVDLARKLRRFHDLIGNTLDTGITSALAENTNTHIAALARRAYGFHTPEALIAMIELTRGGLCPQLPGRAA
ncbi:MAG: transposase [Actinomycetota bacterium]|nr:transposase [Actinomycetota bacterium]